MGWVTGWTYRKSHIINPASGAGQNYQKRIVVHYAAGIDNDENVYLDGKCLINFGDIRFANNSGAFLLDYWMEKKVDSDYAIFWVKVIDDLTVYNSKIYVYYGKAGVVSIANGDSTFQFFDDFETNLNKWSLFGGKSALKFSGSNNLGSPLGFGTVGDFDGYSPFTLECWFKTSGTGEQPLITRMNQAHAGGNGRGYCLFLYNDKIMFELRNTIYAPANEIFIVTNVRSVNDGNWHHVVATYNGSQQASGVHIYIDGTEEPFTTITNTLTDTISNPYRFQVASYAGWAYLTGDIDEIAVYTSVLILSDVVARYNNGEGTEEILSGDVYAHYTLDEGSGTVVNDVSGHPERNLWLATTSGPLPSWITGLVGGPVNSLDYVYSGIKSVKIPINSNISRLQSPYVDKAIHVHFYDRLLSEKKCAVVSMDAGELEESFIGVINDISQYEYQLQDVIYNSGIDRIVGWHEFISRCTNGLKQFIIDDNIMPITGSGNYSPVTFLITAGTAEILAYWDSCFVTKFVSPEPSHGTWGIEETGSGVTIFEAEDIENSISMVPLTLEDVVCSMIQEPRNMENTINSLSGSIHTPAFLSEDVVNLLSGSIHISIQSEDIMNSLERIKNLTVDDVIVLLSFSYHIPLSSENVIRELLAAREFEVVLEFPSGVTRKYPVINSCIIQVGGGLDETW